MATTGFNLAALGFSIYIGRIANFDEIFGSLSAVFVFLLTVYVAVEVMLLGASVSAAWPGVRLQPPRLAVRGCRSSGGSSRARGLVVRERRR